ncbi:hypothetical protein BGW37DRAFT_125275 [Umbelopsis sp. PMI_123]|nr:hypothetical protein BGW37DRAFT_125275 [Umbelopsis sp. PMI_123]
MAAQPLQGKIAIVTGGSRGIGEGIVKEFAKQGATVVVNYTASEDRANALVRQILDDGGQAIAVQADIGTENGAKKIVDATVKAFARIDIIVNNAGVGGFHLIGDSDTQLFEKYFNVNVRGPLLLVKESLPYLQENGRIINISSVAARVGVTGASIYGGTKGALETMSRHWSVELGSKNITSNCINPGPVITDMALSAPKEVLDHLKEMIDQRGAIKRLGTTEDIATVAAFLAGPGSQFITGDVLNANGGLIHM